VDRYDAAARLFLHKPAADLPWTKKIELPGVMELISVGDVTAKLDELLALAPEVRL
jgi:heptosyltransferase I